MTTIPSAGSSRRLGLGQAEARPAPVSAAGATVEDAVPLVVIPWGISVLRPMVGGVALGAIMAIAGESRSAAMKNR